MSKYSSQHDYLFQRPATSLETFLSLWHDSHLKAVVGDCLESSSTHRHACRRTQHHADKVGLVPVQGEDGAAISAAFDKPKPKGAANILAATDNKFVSAAQPDALDTDAETTSDGGSSRLDSGDSKFSNNKDDASAVGIGKATAPGRARNGSKGSSTTVTVQDAMDALSGGKVERSNGSKVKAKAKAKASESSLGGDAELADAGDAPEDREFGELADEPLEFDSIRSSSTAVRGGTAGDRGKDSRSGEDQARKSAVANSGGTSAEKATFEVGTNSIAKGGKARGDSRGGGSSGDKSAVTSTAKDDLEVTLDDGIDVVVPEASGKKGDLAIASEAAGKMAGKAAGKAASKDDLYEQGGTSSKKKDASTAADSLLDLPEDKAYNEVADSLTDAAGMKSKSKAGQSHGSTLEDDLNGELAGKGNGSRDSLGGLTTAIKTAAKSAGKSDLFEISESDTAGGSSSSTGNKKTGKLQQGNIRCFTATQCMLRLILFCSRCSQFMGIELPFGRMNFAQLAWNQVLDPLILTYTSRQAVSGCRGFTLRK